MTSDLQNKATQTPALWLLALLTFSGTLAMHMFVPALPAAAHALGSGSAALQGTISLYILGLAVGQLVYGPVSDRFGRRPVLTFGLSLYTIAGAAAALAPDIGVLLGARLLQALGGSSGLVLARAIVRDTSASDTMARRLAMMNLMVVVGPGLAPLLGTLLNETLGWRAVLGSLTILGIINLVLVRTCLTETDKPAGRPAPGTLIASYLSLLRSPAFIGYCIGGGCATTSMYAFIAAAPFILTDQLHDTPTVTGWVLASPLAGMWVGNILTGRLIGRVHLPRLMLSANMLSLLAAILFLATVWNGLLNTPLTMLYMLMYTAGAGMTSPIAMTEALGINPRLAGSASGIYGCLQMAIGAFCTALVGLGTDPASAVTMTLTGAATISQIAFRIALRCRDRENPTP